MMVAMVSIIGLCSFTLQKADDAQVTEQVSVNVHAQGFMRCSKCYCNKFEGRGQTCRNCGHAFKAHY